MEYNFKDVELFLSKPVLKTLKYPFKQTEGRKSNATGSCKSGKGQDSRTLLFLLPYHEKHKQRYFIETVVQNTLLSTDSPSMHMLTLHNVVWYNPKKG